MTPKERMNPSIINASAEDELQPAAEPDSGCQSATKVI